MNLIYLYLYDVPIELMIEHDQIKNPVTTNMPIFTKETKIFKGVDNKISFIVRNPDRKPVSITHSDIKIRMINFQSRETVLVRYLRPLSEKGTAVLDLFQGDVNNLPPGFYDLIITLEDEEGADSPIFTDLNDDIVTTVNLIERALPPVSFTTEVTEFTEQGDLFVSSAVPGTRIRNFIHSLHTVAVYTTNFTGTLKVKATLEIVPGSTLDDFFDVDVSSISDEVVFGGVTGITPFNFNANFVWLKFVYEPDSTNTGTVDKILIRS